VHGRVHFLLGTPVSSSSLLSWSTSAAYTATGFAPSRFLFLVFIYAFIRRFFFSMIFSTPIAQRLSSYLPPLPAGNAGHPVLQVILLVPVFSPACKLIFPFRRPGDVVNLTVMHLYAPAVFHECASMLSTAVFLC